MLQDWKYAWHFLPTIAEHYTTNHRVFPAPTRRLQKGAWKVPQYPRPMQLDAGSLVPASALPLGPALLTPSPTALYASKGKAEHHMRRAWTTGHTGSGPPMRKDNTMSRLPSSSQPYHCRSTAMIQGGHNLLCARHAPAELAHPPRTEPFLSRLCWP